MTMTEGNVSPRRSEGRGVVLVNVGTPEAPTPAAVRRYLAEFLDDPRVIDLPGPARWMLLNLIILPFRPRRSARAYQQIWTPEGSPLMLHARAQVAALRRALPGVEVVLAMRYGSPSMEGALRTLRELRVTHVTLVPMYPQYASATTGSTVAAWYRLLGAQPQPPATAVLPAFHAHAGFIEACAERLRETVLASRAEHVLFSYHGVPVRHLAPFCRFGCGAAGQACPPVGRGNEHCYRAQCHATSEALALAADLPSTSTAFQSRLKGATWLSPFTDEAVVALARGGVKRLAVACPSFVADCLETLEEIGLRAADSFRAAGGDVLTLVPSVNDSPTFIASLADQIRRSPT